MSSTRRPMRRKFSVEGLESRLAMSGVGASPAQVHAQRAGVGTITGRVTDSSTGRGLGPVKVDLIDSGGNLVASSDTGRHGYYRFRVPADGSYVVREVTPRRYTQVTPGFSDVAPTGAYAPGYGATSWNYVTGNSDPTLGPVGPASWAAIAPAGNESFESPINLSGPTVDLSKYLTVDYAPATPTHIVDNGHQIQVQFASTPADSITAGGIRFNLSQFHYHDPSENTIDNHAFSMEEHFVNVSPTGATAVVAVFLKLGAHDDALQPILDAATRSLSTANSTTPGTAPVDFAGLLPTSTQGYFYRGSLTTPPLSLPVNWFVYATPITLDHAQLAQYEKVAAGAGFLPNARPVQPLDGRRLNENDYDVTFRGTSLANLDFGLGRRAQA